MKRVEVTMPPAKLDDLREALAEVDVPGMTVGEARVFGPAGRRREVYRGTSYVVDHAPMITIEIVARDDLVPGILEAMAQLPEVGASDGRVFISDVVEAVRIRTSEHGQEAIDHAAYSLHSTEA
jgi:nitrogen regulatory protein PII